MNDTSPTLPAAPAVTALPDPNVTMPGRQVNAQGREMSTVLDDAGRQKAFAHFMDMWDRAGQKPPAFKKGDDPAAFNAAMDKYKANPLFAKRENITQRFQQDTAKYGAEEAATLYQYNMKQLTDNYMRGIDLGAQDPSLDDKRKSAFGQLLSLDIMGAIKSFALSIPFVGDLIASAGKWVMAKVNGTPMTFAEAREQITLEKAYGGAAAALGVDVGAMVVEGKAFAKSDATAAPTAPVPGDVKTAQEHADGAVPQTIVVLNPGFDKPNGTGVPPQSVPAAGVTGAGMSPK